MYAIEVRSVRRTFRTTTGTFRRASKEIVALDGVDLQIPQGQLFGLLGPNGAGKTTTIKILTTLLIPTSGSASVLGHDVVRDAGWVRPRIGFVLGGERGLYYRLSGRENLAYFAELYRVPVREVRSRIDELLELVGLRDRAEERVEGYSRGMKQRLHLARTLLHRPPVLFLDEPTIGLDPIGARELRDTVGHLHAEGKTIVLTTHYMFEADALCDRIAVLSGGRIVAQGSPADLKAVVSDLSVVELEVFGASPAVVEGLRALEGIDSVVVEPRELKQLLRVQTPLADRAIPRILAAIEGIEVGRVTVSEATLEDAYVRLVGRLE
ncbi:MAG: ATP-binding cassette domain-containing protein [Chloroflexota bacterium]|nr:ATP-binding cassette domain-containing protein [Chloroflexota bacterium]